MPSSDNQIEHVEQVLQYTFFQKSYLKAALWNRQTTPDETQESSTHNRDSLAALGESTLRTAFQLEGFHPTPPSSSGRSTPVALADRDPLTLPTDRLSHQIHNPELATIGYHRGLERLINVHRSSERTDALVATVVKAILGAVFLDSAHSMLAVRTVMEALGFSFNQPRETTSHQQTLARRLQQLETGSHTSRTASPDCFNGPDCGCGCLWLDQYSSAGWYTPPLKDPLSRASAQMSPFARSQSFKARRLQSTGSRSSMERTKDWVIHVEPGMDYDCKTDPWIKSESLPSPNTSMARINESLDMSKCQLSIKAESE